MKASKIELSGECRIKLEFPYNYYAASLLKQIPGAKWSMKAWHIPYTKAAFAQLKKLFPLVDYPQKSTGEISSEPVVKTAVPEFNNQDHQNKNVSVQVTGRMIILKLPKNALDTHFITSFRYSRWDGKQFCWIVPNYPGNLDLIHDYFNERIYELIVYEDFEVKISADTQRKIKTNQLIIIKAVTGRLKLIFGFNNELSYHIKTMPYSHWDAKNKWWTIPYSEKFLHEIQIKATALNLEVLYEEEVVGKEDKVKRISPFNVANFQRCPEEYSRKLKELRYTPKTSKTYQSMFEEFINYYNSQDINQIDDKQIIAFLQYLVIKRKVSPSYQNQSINAIKFYYEHVLGGERKFYFLERPRKERKLPNVLSESEITNTIKLVRNLKHKGIRPTNPIFSNS